MIKLKRLGVVLQPKGSRDSVFAKFNAGMVADNGVVHMLYRWGEKMDVPGWKPDFDNSGGPRHRPGGYLKDYISYARLTPEGRLLEDYDKPVICATHTFEAAGCQDPRIVKFEGAWYIFYCAWNLDRARVAVARTTDFKSYTKIGVIDNFAWDKDAYIFPERINGKIAYVHRIEPSIQIDYVDTFEELVSRERWVDYKSRWRDSVALESAFPEWEGTKIGGSAPPIKTDQGWLFTYHGVDRKWIYHVGIALLDLKAPFKVLARLPYPVLSPEEDYETHGHYYGVVFPAGAYVHNGELYVCYGAADKYVALAKIGMNDLMRELERHRQ
jgi:predicted GH43/DUF377 family glycosyl hydrolase